MRGYKRVVKATATRWYSNVDMLESMAVRDEIITMLDESRHAEQLNLLQDEEFIEDINSVLGILRPLANCIAIAERTNSSLGEAFRAFLDFVKPLFDASWDKEPVARAIEAVLIYFNDEKLGEDELGLLLASYFLDRRFKMDYVTESGTDLVYATLIKIGALTGYDVDMIESCLLS